MGTVGSCVPTFIFKEERSSHTPELTEERTAMNKCIDWSLWLFLQC